MMALTLLTGPSDSQPCEHRQLSEPAAETAEQEIELNQTQGSIV